MKIVGISNFNLDHVSDILIAENVNPYYGKKIIDLLQKYDIHESDTYYLQLVEDDYKLYDGSVAYE